MIPVTPFCFSYFLRQITEPVPPIRHRNTQFHITTERLSSICLPSLGRHFWLVPLQRIDSKKDPQWHNFNFLSTSIKMDHSELFLMNLMKALDTLPRKTHTPKTTNSISVASWNPSMDPIRTPGPLIGSSNKWPKWGLRNSCMFSPCCLSISKIKGREKVNHVQSLMETWNAAQHSCW